MKMDAAKLAIMKITSGHMVNHIRVDVVMKSDVYYVMARGKFDVTIMPKAVILRNSLNGRCF